MARIAVTKGTVLLVYDRRLGFGGYRDYLSKARPCWVARLNRGTALVLPFTTQTWRYPVRFRAGDGGLRADSSLIPTLVEVRGEKLGPAIGWLDAIVVCTALEHMLMRADRPSLRTVLAIIDPPDQAA